MRKFKHKITGDIAEGVDTFYRSKDMYTIPAKYVENSNDWEEIKEVKLDVPIGTKFKEYDCGSIYTIDHIDNSTVQVCLDGVPLYTSGFEVEYVNIQFKLGNWIIYKEPLFLDELGNEIIEDSIVWIIEGLNTPWSTKAIYPKNSTHWNLFKDHKENTKIFVNKLDAENYINENKPKFSKKQVLDALEWGKYEYYRSIASTEWFRVVKEKLGL